VRLSRGRWSRGLVLGLVVWFAWLNAFAVLLHDHTGTACDDETVCGAGFKPLLSRIIDAPNLGVAAQEEHKTVTDKGLCPVCLFLIKNIAEPPFAPPNATPRDHASRRAGVEENALVALRNTSTCGPRAPPPPSFSL
jgi:hypothetical protein